MDFSPPAASHSWRKSVAAFVALLSLPLLVAIDTLWAMARGWSWQEAGALGLPAVAASAVLVAGLLSFVLWPRLRRALARNLTGCCVFGGATLIALSAEELALSVLWPAPPFHCRLPRTEYTFEPNPFQLPGSSARSHVSFNSQGLRGPEWPARDRAYRILCLGDSATECLYIDDAETWTSVLARELPEIAGQPTWVGAAAVCEYATAQHVKFLQESPLVDEVDCIVAMVGVNDFLRSVMQLDERGVAPPLWLRSRLVGLARYLWNGLWRNGYYYDHDGRTLRFRRLGRPIAPFPLDQRRIAAAFKERLRAMAEAAQARGVRLVFVTQPVLWDDFLGEAGLRRLWLARTDPVPREWTSLEFGNCRETIDEYNDVMIEVGRDTGTEVADLAPALTGWDYNFYDDYHLSTTGCSNLGKALAGYFRERATK